jgi:aryl-alcohol dehydrogenase-like predicted oxidoreductase
VELRRLGRSSLQVTPIGLGCWQFSEGRGAGRYWPALGAQEVEAIVRASLEGGVTWFDTAEVYGGGRSEEGLAGALRALGRAPGDVVIATKWFPLLRTAGSIRRTIGERLARLRGFGIDLHQVHAPVGSLSSHRQQMEAMADLVRAGKIRAVGVSNFSAAAMRRCHEVLARSGIPLASNQVRYSLLDRRIETNGVLDVARDLGVSIIAYSPLAQGVLSGKFHDPNVRPTGPRRLLPQFRARGLARSAPVVEELRRIAAARGGTPSQVALRWLLQFHGDLVVAIPGATKVRQAEDNAGVLRFALTSDEIERIDVASRQFR